MHNIIILSCDLVRERPMSKTTVVEGNLTVKWANFKKKNPTVTGLTYTRLKFWTK